MRISETQPPRTMTKAGLQFLTALAQENNSGCFVEVGPLFGSSTLAIAAGRQDPDLHIHTLDTFEPAAWVKKRFGFDLNREKFNHFTKSINNLIVHQGYSPDCVKQSWEQEIGFYFDDATHGNPGWMNNFDFFSDFFSPDVILCGDDFSGGWPDVVKNVYDIAEANDWRLHVIGRVWAMTPQNEPRILDAVNRAFPRLKSFEWEVCHGTRRCIGAAASWAWGLHKSAPLKAAKLRCPSEFKLQIEVVRSNGSRELVDVSQSSMSFENAARLKFQMPDDFSIQFCVANKSGGSQNTRNFKSGTEFSISPHEHVTSLRLSHEINA